MLGGIYYIRMSIFLTAATFALSACSGGGGSSTTPNQNPANKTLNQFGTNPAGRAGQSQPAFASGQYTINNPSNPPAVPKTTVGQSTQQDPPPTSASTASGTDQVVGEISASGPTNASNDPASGSGGGAAGPTAGATASVSSRVASTSNNARLADPIIPVEPG